MGAAFLLLEKIMERHGWMHPWGCTLGDTLIHPRQVTTGITCQRVHLSAALGDLAVIHEGYSPSSTALLLPRPPHTVPLPP